MDSEKKLLRGAKAKAVKSRIKWCKTAPACGSCAFIGFDTVEVAGLFGTVLRVDKNVRCTKHNIRTGKASWCPDYMPKGK